MTVQGTDSGTISSREASSARGTRPGSVPAASVRIEHLTHWYPGAVRPALDDVGFVVEPGMRLGLLGPNGAGKSTLMRIVCGFLPVQTPRSGAAVRVEVAGLDVRDHSMEVRARVGYLPEQVPLYTELRVREHLAFRARIKRVPRKIVRREIERVAELTGIDKELETPIFELSRGYRQRVGIADALLGSPPLLILDEPTVGLDPNQVLEIRGLLQKLGGAQTLVFSSHILAEVEALCDRVVILSEGRVVADESLAAALLASRVTARVLAPEEVVQDLLREAWADVGLRDAPEPTIEVDGDEARVTLALPPVSVPIDDVLTAVGRVCARRGVVLRELAPGRTRLEQRFAEVTGARRGRDG